MEEIHLAHVEQGVEVNLEVVLEQTISADIVPVDQGIASSSFLTLEDEMLPPEHILPAFPTL